MKGILTIVTPDGYFEGFKILVESINQYPIATFNLGLNPAQLAWCTSHGVNVLPCPALVMPKTVDMWATWNKAQFISNSPFSETLYIDADCMVCGDLTPVFDHISKQMLLLRHPFWHRYPGGGNAAHIYDETGVARRLLCTINAGVMGFVLERDALFLTNVMKMVQQAAVDPHVRKGLAYWDEGATIWTIESMGLDTTILERHDWNLFSPKSVGCQSKAEWLAKVPRGGVIRHFTGIPKYWTNWKK